MIPVVVIAYKRLNKRYTMKDEKIGKIIEKAGL